MGSASQLYFWHVDQNQQHTLGCIDLKTMHVSLNVCEVKKLKGEVSSFTMTSLRSIKRYIFLILGRHSLLQPVEMHVYDLVDQYWEKLSDLPFMANPMPFPIITTVERHSESFIYVTNNDWQSVQAKSPVSL